MSLISEITQHLHNNSIGTSGTNLFYSQMPDKDTDFLVCVYDRVGPAPDIDITEIKSPMFQILIRSKDYGTGKAKLDAIRALLHGVINKYLVPGGIYFRKIHASSEGGHIGINDANKDEFSINFLADVIE